MHRNFYLRTTPSKGEIIMNEKMVQNVIDYAKKLSAEGLASENASITFRHDNELYTTKQGVDFAKITADDVFFVDLDVFDSNKPNDDTAKKLAGDIYALNLVADADAIIRIDTYYTLVCAEKGKSIPPVLDDMSQILGVKIKCSASSEPKDLVKALAGKRACLIKGEGALTVGRSLDEAFTAAMVMEKACRTRVRVTALGGSHNLGFLDANLQHLIYKIKYSKKNQAAKIAKEQEEA